MLKGDRVCKSCGRLIFSYTKRKVDFDKWKYKCPHCGAWQDMDKSKNKIGATPRRGKCEQEDPARKLF